MGQASTIGLDIAKWVFQAHGADATGRVVFRKRLVRLRHKPNRDPAHAVISGKNFQSFNLSNAASSLGFRSL